MDIDVRVCEGVCTRCGRGEETFPQRRGGRHHKAPATRREQCHLTR